MTDDELRTILADRIESVRKRIQSACARVGRPSSEVTLIAVTKTVSPRVASVLPDLGIVDIGESRPQELWRKAEALKHLPIRWHLIGHLQRNKVERTLPLVHLIHSVDSARLLDAIAAESEKRQTRTRVLLEVNISGEAQKHGFDPDELTTLVANKNIEIAGLMGMAALSSESEAARPAFAKLRTVRDQLQAKWPTNQLTHLSMGMSGDFDVAIEEGATLVRIGTTLFEGLEIEI